MGFEPMYAMQNGLVIHHLNRSAMVSLSDINEIFKQNLYLFSLTVSYSLVLSE